MKKTHPILGVFCLALIITLCSVSIAHPKEEQNAALSSENSTSGTTTYTTTQTSTQGVVFYDGFESGDFSAWDGTDVNGVSLSVETATPPGAYAGTHYMQVKGLGGEGDHGYPYKALATTYNKLYLQCQFRMNNVFSDWEEMPPYCATSGGEDIATVIVNSTKWGVRHEYASFQYINYWESGTSTISADTWYTVKMEVYVHATNGFLTLWIDGVLKLNQTNISTYTWGNIGGVNAYNWMDNAQSPDRTIYVDEFIASTTDISPTWPKYDIVFTVKDSVGYALLKNANVTVYNGASVPENKIKSGITASDGKVRLTDLPGGILTITVYDSGIPQHEIANVTRTVTTDEQQESILCVDNKLDFTILCKEEALRLSLGSLIIIGPMGLQVVLDRRRNP